MLSHPAAALLSTLYTEHMLSCLSVDLSPDHKTATSLGTGIRLHVPSGPSGSPNTKARPAHSRHSGNACRVNALRNIVPLTRWFSSRDSHGFISAGQALEHPDLPPSLSEVCSISGSGNSLPDVPHQREAKWVWT